MHAVRAILLLVTLAAAAQAQLETCDGAYARYVELLGVCPAPATCAECKTAISSIDDSTLSSWKTGLTACGNLPEGNGLKSMAQIATYFNYQWLYSLAFQCGHDASIVKVSPPALNTCDGANVRYLQLQNTCPSSGTGPRTPATCDSAACKEAITSIDDNTLSSMKAGLTACGGNLHDSYLNYQYLYSLAGQCGHDASTVKVTPPALNTCDGAYARYLSFSSACPYPYSPTTKCGNASCATAISFFNDSTLSTMNTGFMACGNLN